MQVRTSDGKTKWKDLSDLEPPSADAPHTGVVIGPDGELLEPHWAADQAALKEEQAAAQEEAASHLAAHMGAMARLRRAMSSTDEIEGETSDEDDSDDGAPPRNRIPVPMAGRAPQSVAASGVVPSGISNSGGGGGGAGRVRWEKVSKQLRMQQRVVKAFNPGAFQRTVQRGASIPAAVPTHADLIAAAPRPAAAATAAAAPTALPKGMPPPPAGLQMGRVPSTWRRRHSARLRCRRRRRGSCRPRSSRHPAPPPSPRRLCQWWRRRRCEALCSPPPFPR